MLGDFKSEFKAIQFIMDIYNLSIKESQWSIEQRENIDMMINNITLNKFQELCPQADKNIKYAKDTFLMMLSIARNNIYSEKFSNDDGEIVFYVTNKKLAEYMGKKNEYGEIVNRTTTKASDERTLKISEVILHCIQSKGYCTEKEVVYILGNEYRYEVTETQIKRCLNEIMDCYGLKKVKANKVLKEQFDIKSDGYPYIIIEDEI